MTSLFDDRFQALGEPWAREADERLAIRARAQHRLAAWACDSCDTTIPDRNGTVRRLLKAGFEPEGEAAFLRAVADETGKDPEDLAKRLESYADEAASEARSDA